MKKHFSNSILIIFICALTFNSFCQKEEMAPLNFNTQLFKANHSLIFKSVQNTFDSTFIYTTDTLELPFFDEFSKNHFQVYPNDFSAPGVTSTTKYRLLNDITLLPVANGISYTDQQTFRRIYDINTTTSTDENFPSVVFQVGDLSSYPVNYVPIDLYPPYYIYDTVGVADVSDTVWIANPPFFQDSATQFFANLNDPNAFWLDDYAYHNYRFAVQPRSLGVVSFDGLDENGYPYAINSTMTNYADILTSKPINLEGVSAADSLYFSFLYQPQGFGDVPESSDSLVLEFFAKDLNQWFRVWSAQGEPLTDFKVGHIGIIDAKYLKKGFQFRFKNYGALSGMLDVFNLDYVHLRTLSGYQDTLFKDFAIVYPIGSLIKNYTSVPWDHFKNNPVGKMNDFFEVTVHNGSNLPENNQNGQVTVSYNGSAEGNFVLNAQELSGGDLNYFANTFYTTYHDLSGGYQYDISKTGNFQSFDISATASAQFPNLAQNDSTTGVQQFSNFYSYDDGSAEAAYGPTGNQARLAIKYNTYESDSLIGIAIHFVPTVNDVSNKLFLLSVWDDDGGVPGNLLYEDDVFFPRQPYYGNTQNEFFNYWFIDTLKVAVGTTFYVGWRQFDPERLNVGLDRNIDKSENTYYSIDGGANWNQSTINGSVMIRPIFSTNLDAELGIDPILQPNVAPIKIYPNPSNDYFSVEITSENLPDIELYASDGKLIRKEVSSKTMFVHDIPNGIYFVKIVGNNKMIKFLKN
jgi:hypothetical protein